MRRILYILLDNYADHELAFLSQAINAGERGPIEHPKYENKIVAPTLEPIQSIGGLRTLPDYSFDTMPSDYAALVLIGGYGWITAAAEPLATIVKDALVQGKIVGAICNAASWMAKQGFLNHVKHTGNGIDQLNLWGGEHYTNQAGYVNEQAVSDGGIVTANGSAYLEFARELLLLLQNDTPEMIERYYQFNKQGFVKLFATPQPNYTKWVACWGNATSITDRKECVYAKDITLRYPIWMCFSGSRLRFRFSNLTGTEAITISKAFVAKRGVDNYQPIAITFGNQASFSIKPGTEITSDAIAVDVQRGEHIEVSMYFADYTQMNAGTFISGPLSKGQYSYGDFAECEELPLDLTRGTNWFYFLNTIDVWTEEQNHALVCYGDSITAQSWPDYLTKRCFDEGHTHVAIIRRAVSGTRILRQYDCITYQAYGLKGATRFPIELNVAGAKAVIIQHGINDIIHPVGTDVNPFRPWSDMPTCEQLEKGVEEIYVAHARKLGLKVWAGTLLPIYGWRTYNEDRDALRQAFNQWMRTSPLFDGCVDFDQAVCDPNQPKAFAPGYDSGDHLHPSEKAYAAMAACVPEDLLR